MDTQKIIGFLKAVAANNNRQWFNDHRAEYEDAKADFEAGTAKAIARIATFDPSISHITVKDATYRFYRDTRFSPDKSPYKRHFGAYIAAHGKKALHGGYYLHIEPGNCLVAVGNYWLPTNVLTACRNEIIGNITRWRDIVENEGFVGFFGHPGQGVWGDAKGFGLEMLKKCPAGFDRNYEFIDYLRMKDFCCWKAVPDTFFEGDGWLDSIEEILTTAKPMMDFINDVIDDYE